MAYIDQYDLSDDTVFRKRVRIAMLTAAANVQAEATSTANHTNRANYAKLVLNAPDAYIAAFSQATCTNAAITSTSLDGDLQFEVNSIWNAMAGTI
ncbi:MAG: hypothetical protein LC745_03685 [Planctomycetia bacterium]|nr:hypothetical protein [Planctomycetia bacterium]